MVWRRAILGASTRLHACWLDMHACGGVQLHLHDAAEAPVGGAACLFQG